MDEKNLFFIQKIKYKVCIDNLIYNSNDRSNKFKSCLFPLLNVAHSSLNIKYPR